MTSLTHLLADFREYQPTIFIGGPLLLKTVHSGIIKKIQLDLLEKIKSLSTTIEIKELYFQLTIGDVISKAKIEMLIEKIGANNGKEN